MIEPPKCPDCGAPMNVEEKREPGRIVHKEEVGMLYAGDREAWEEYKKLPAILGRTPPSPWVKTETCTRCQYQAVDGRRMRRGKATG